MRLPPVYIVIPAEPVMLRTGECSTDVLQLYTCMKRRAFLALTYRQSKNSVCKSAIYSYYSALLILCYQTLLTEKRAI